MNHASAETILRDNIDVEKLPIDGIARLKGRPILIYGAGNYGQIICRLLFDNEVSENLVIGFLDAACVEDATLLGLPVKRPEDISIPESLRLKAVVIISIYCSIEEQLAIKEKLYGLGYQNVRTCYEIAISFHTVNDPSTRISKTDFLTKNLDNILRASKIWDDQRSLETYVNHFVGYAKGDIDCFLCETDHKQYFAPLPIPDNGYSNFIDCGAFDGDTIRELYKHCGKVENIFLFEPCVENLDLLQNYVTTNQSNLADHVVLFPCGVWDKIEQLRFASESAAASSISAEGDTLIQGVAIDEVLFGFDPTFIKMDVEGAELQALFGAATTIKRCTPTLAISVYHSLSHFWEIPELIKNLNPEYRFHLRTYGASGFETVMYAVAAH